MITHQKRPHDFFYLTPPDPENRNIKNEKTDMIPILGTVLGSTAKTLLISLLSEKVIIKVLIGNDEGGGVLGWLVKRSTNTLDDQLVNTIRERLQETGKL